MTRAHPTCGLHHRVCECPQSAPASQSHGRSAGEVSHTLSGVTDINILIGCEYSASERDAFRALGFNAWSCDFKPCEGDPRWHFQTDVRVAIRLGGWDLIILHLDCTKMAVCGNKHYGAGKPKHHERVAALDEAEAIVRLALEHSPHVVVENPASVIFPMLRQRLNADVQYIQPWQHGHPEQKKTGLALWGLPRLTETNNVHAHMMTLPRKERERIFFMSPGSDRGHERSRAYDGISAAFARQWGDHLLHPLNNTQARLTERDPVFVPHGGGL